MRVARSLFPMFVLLVALPLSAQQLEIHYIDVGWGGSVFIKGPDGTTVLLEAGNTGMGTQYVVPYLKSIGIQPANGLDYMIGGHQHCDHIGGLDEVINAGYNVRGKQYFNGSSYASSCVDGLNPAAGTTPDYLRLADPDVAIVGGGAGGTSGWDLPRIDVVEHVLLGQSSSCITAPPTFVLQTEEGAPAGSLTSHAGYCVGNIRITTDGF